RLGHRAERGDAACPSADGPSGTAGAGYAVNGPGIPDGKCSFCRKDSPAQSGDFDLRSSIRPRHGALAGGTRTRLHRPGGNHMRSKLTRRRFLATTTASSALIAMPFVRGSHAAGKLSIGFWDHWVP